jgi:hypothetical protein
MIGKPEVISKLKVKILSSPMKFISIPEYLEPNARFDQSLYNH